MDTQTQSNREAFQAELTRQYADLFTNDPEYAFSATHTTPEALAQKMTAGLETGAANNDGEGIKRTCKHFKIAHTYKAIRAFFNAQ